MTEPEVLQKVHQFLKAGSHSPSSTHLLYTDAHPTLTGIRQLKPFQRVSLNLGDYTVHPDLVGQLSDGETLLAVEAKGTSNVTKGLAQAQFYQEGFHISCFAAASTAIGDWTLDFARQHNLGLLRVSDSVQIAHWPVPRAPRMDTCQAIRKQLDLARQVSHQAYVYNLPTHYLVWPIALRGNQKYYLSDLTDALTNYPIPDDWKPALRGAGQLGLLRTDGEEVHLTRTGIAVRELLNTSTERWAKIHHSIKREPLADCAPQAAAVLRMLLLREEACRLIISGLQSVEENSATIDQLARTCAKIDAGNSAVLFLKPESMPAITDNRGNIQWNQVTASDFRPTTSYQYKSMLRHAGIIEYTRLGGTHVPVEKDVWTLRG